MKLPRYELKAEQSLMVFEFISEGTKGEIPKLIKFSDTNLKNLYNLAFGDKIQTQVRLMMKWFQIMAIAKKILQR